jgi:hypothetical protein
LLLEAQVFALEMTLEMSNSSQPHCLFECSFAEAHFKAFKNDGTVHAPVVVTQPAHPTTNGTSLQPSVSKPTVESIFDRVLPSSIAYHCNGPLSEMPLIQHLRNGFDGGKAPAWHRNEERQIRNLPPALNANVHFEPWEIDMVWTETLLLTSNPEANFTHLAYAWGQEPGFHVTAVRALCRHRSVNVSRSRHGSQRGAAVGVTAYTSPSSSGAEDGGNGQHVSYPYHQAQHHHYQQHHHHHYQGNPEALPRHNREMSVEMSLEFAASFLQQLQGDYGVDNSFDEEDEHAPNGRAGI